MFVPNITGTIADLHHSRSLRLLAVNATARHPALTDVPTAAEAGLAGMITQNIFGIFGPAGLPPEVTRVVNEATRQAIAEPEFQRRLATAGFEPVHGLDPAGSLALMQADLARWETIVRTANIKE